MYNNMLCFVIIYDTQIKKRHPASAGCLFFIA